MAKKRRAPKAGAETKAEGEAHSLAEPLAPSPPARLHVFRLIYLAIAGFALIFGGGIAIGLSPAMVMLLMAGVAVVGVTLLLVLTFHSLVADPPPEATRRATGRRRKELEREKQSLLKALKELSFDHEMRKISDDDYRDVASAYRARAVRVMRQLDEAGGDFRKLVEQDAAARRIARGSGPQPPVVVREPEPPPPVVTPAPAGSVAGAAASPVATADGSGSGSGSDPVAAAPVAPAVVAMPGRRLCAKCEADNESDAAFCKKCGQSMQAAAGSAR